MRLSEAKYLGVNLGLYIVMVNWRLFMIFVFMKQQRNYANKLGRKMTHFIKIWILSSTTDLLNPEMRGIHRFSIKLLQRLLILQRLPTPKRFWKIRNF